MAETNPEPQKKGRDNLAEGAKGGAIAFSLKISNIVLAFLNQVLLARILGAGGVGEVILAITVVRIAVQFAKFGLEETMMKFIPLYVDRQDDSKLKGTISFAVKFSLLISIILMLFVLMFSRFISLNIFHSEGLLKLMPVVVVAIPAWVMRDVISGILKGYKDAYSALVPEAVVSPIVKIAVFLVLILQGVSPFFAIIAFVAGEILSVIVSIRLLQKRLAVLKPVKGQCEKRRIMEVAYTIIFTGMSVLLYTQADVWILGMFKSTEIVGIYGIATKLVLLVTFPMMAFAAIIPSLISSIHASGDIAELRKVVSGSTRWILSTAMPIILILIIEGKYILKYFYGEEFVAGYVVLVILTFGQMIKSAAGLIGVLLQMTGEHKVFMKVNIFFGLLNIILNILLVPQYGMIGAAAATAFCLSMVDIISIFIIHKRLSVLTLAKGINFDIVFIVAVTSVYFIFNYIDFYIGHHLLLAVALTVYLWKSISNHDIPWKFLIGK